MEGLTLSVTSATLCAQNATHASLIADAVSPPSFAFPGQQPILVESLGVVGKLSAPKTSAISLSGLIRSGRSSKGTRMGWFYSTAMYL